MTNKFTKQDIRAHIIKNCSDINNLASILLMFGSTIIKSLNRGDGLSENNLKDIEDVSYMFHDITAEIDKNAHQIANILQ